ncbi:MAG: response regulator [Verrucomicrobiia bacterium]
MNDFMGSNFWLVVEDDDNDFLLFERACSLAIRSPPFIHREPDGIAAKAFLTSNHAKPKLIISDLKMPRMNGLELLDWLRREPKLRELRFVMLTSSNAEKDVSDSKQLGVDDYRVKPSSVRDLARIVEEMFTLVEPTQVCSGAATVAEKRSPSRRRSPPRD